MISSSHRGGTAIKVYVAGPYSANNIIEIEANVRRAINAGIDLMRLGHEPFIPHLTHFVEKQDKENLHGESQFGYEDWMRVDDAYLQCCDALLYLGSSPGADRERNRAHALSLRIYTSVADIPPAVAEPWRDEPITDAEYHRLHAEGFAKGIVTPTAQVWDEIGDEPMTAGNWELLKAKLKGAYVTKDSGQRRDFDTGSRRDTDEGKGMPALISPFALQRLAGLYERGARKYGDRNWEKGQPFTAVTNSLFRHLLAWMEGQDDEDHLAAIMWNAAALMHFQEAIQRGLLPHTLDDMPRYSVNEAPRDIRKPKRHHHKGPVSGEVYHKLHSY